MSLGHVFPYTIQCYPTRGLAIALAVPNRLLEFVCCQPGEIVFILLLVRHIFFFTVNTFHLLRVLISLAVRSAVIGEFDEVEDAGKDLSRIKAEPLKPVTH